MKVFSPTGSSLATLSDTTGSTYTTGMAQDAAGNLYVTNFSTSTVSKFDTNGNLVSANFLTGGPSSPESIALDLAGNFYVGGPGTPHFYKYAPGGGTPTATFNTTCSDGNGGTDWLDLAADQSTVLYTCEGSAIHSFNTATNTANSNFASGLPGTAYALRIIPSGTFAGDVLVADSSNALLLNSSGAIVKTYSLPSNDGSDFALNLDPDGNDFWTADTSGHVWEVNIASGAIVHQFSTGSATFGLLVVGQITAGAGGGGGGATTPAPSSLVLLGIGLIGLAMFFGFRKLAAR